jgi:hypothetical protein
VNRIILKRKQPLPERQPHKSQVDQLFNKS